MATCGRDFHPGIGITFLSGSDDGDDGASDVAKYAYESDKDEPYRWASQYLLPSSTSSANESLPYISSIVSESCWAPYGQRSRAQIPSCVEVKSLTCKPLASSSKPKARTIVRAGLNSFSSKVSMDALFWCYLEHHGERELETRTVSR